MARIDLEIRDVVYDALMVRDGQRIDPMIARERANNIAAILCCNFCIHQLRYVNEVNAREKQEKLFERPDPSEDDERICTGGGR